MTNYKSFIICIVTYIVNCVTFLQDRDRVTFEQGDACNLRSDIGQFGCVLGANLICRLPTPLDFLDRLPNIVVPGGIVVLTSPYSWLEEYTSKVSIKHMICVVVIVVDWSAATPFVNGVFRERGNLYIRLCQYTDAISASQLFSIAVTDAAPVFIVLRICKTKLLLYTQANPE